MLTARSVNDQIALLSVCQVPAEPAPAAGFQHTVTRAPRISARHADALRAICYLCSYSASWNTAATGTCASMLPGRHHRVSVWQYDLRALHRFCSQVPRAQNMSQRAPWQALQQPPLRSLPIHPRRWLTALPRKDGA